jgi:hypothetical protein
MVYFNLEGGFGRIEPKRIPEADKITLIPLPMLPMSAKRAGDIPKATVLWHKLQTEYARVLEDKDVATIVVDSASLLRQAASLSHLADIQKTEPTRKSLTPFEYLIPNSELREFIIQADLHGKQLILIHHTKPKYVGGVETEEREADGFGETGDLVDVEFWMGKRKNSNGMTIPYGVFRNCGVCMKAEGMEVEEPTFTKLETLINNMRNLK